MKLRVFFGCLFLCFGLGLLASEPSGPIYWVQFNSKVGTQYSISNPQAFLSARSIERRMRQEIAIDSTDLPVNHQFVDSLRSMGFFVKHTSKWQNGAIIVADSILDLTQMVLPSFIDTIILRKGLYSKSLNNKFGSIESPDSASYSASYKQIEMMAGIDVHRYAKGSGVHVAIIDAGFENADQIDALKPLFLNGQIMGTYDFVLPGNNVYNEYEHGTNVLSLMGANIPGQLIGSAPLASYWLLRSEDVNTEFPVEEDYWLVAIEFADSVGCEVVNTSLGYSLFDDVTMNHNYDDFDGKTLLISKSANLAVHKGIVVVCSAGNERYNSWGKIVAPAEAESVLAVAAVNYDDQIASFSSPGFENRRPLKPDVSALGVSAAIAKAGNYLSHGNGTSFSSPLLAGMVACLVQLAPNQSASEIIDWVKKAGNRYPEFSIDYGYGVPNFMNIFSQNHLITSVAGNIENTPKIYPNPFESKIQISNSKDFFSFKLFDLTGREVFVFHFNGYFSEDEIIEISPDIANGNYLGVLFSKQGTRTYKLVKN